MTTEFERLQMLLRCPGNVAWQDNQQVQTRHQRRHSDAGDNMPATATVSDGSLVVHHHDVNFEHLLQFPDLSCKLSRKTVTRSFCSIINTLSNSPAAAKLYDNGFCSFNVLLPSVL